MEKLLKRFLVILGLALNFNLEVVAMEPETVTFQGAVTRHLSSDNSIEVSGVIRFDYDYVSDDGQYYIEHPFTIPAGQNSVAYSKTLSWDLPGSLSNDPDRRYFDVSINCLVNCEEASINRKTVFYMENGKTSIFSFIEDDGLFFPERFGEDERDNAYIVDLALIPRYFTLAVDVKLPNEAVAQEDIPITFIAEDFYFTGGSASYYRFNITIDDHVINKGQSGGQFNILFDLEVDYRAEFVGEIVYFGYECLSSACERADILQEAWLGEAQNELFSDASSAAAFEIIPYVNNGDYYFELPQPLELLSRNNSVEVKLTRDSKSINQTIEGNLIVEKVFYRTFCDAIFSENGTPVDYSQNNVCEFPELLLNPGLVSITKFSLSEGELETVVAINMETIKTNDAALRVVGDRPYQTIRFECTSGCDNTQHVKQGYLRENGKFTSLFEVSAKKFYQTEDFYQNDLILSLTRPPLIMPWLELLMQESEEESVD